MCIGEGLALNEPLYTVRFRKEMAYSSRNEEILLVAVYASQFYRGPLNLGGLVLQEILQKNIIVLKQISEFSAC